MNFTAAHLCGLIFIWYAAISVTWSHPYDGLDALVKLIVIAEAFVLGTNLTDLKPVIIGFGLGMWVNSAILLLGIDVPHTSDLPAGLFVNSNSLGEIAGLVLVAAVFYKSEWAVPESESSGAGYLKPDVAGFKGEREQDAWGKVTNDTLSTMGWNPIRPEYRLWWLFPGILPALLLSHSRGALAAVAGAFAIWVWNYDWKFFGLRRTSRGATGSLRTCPVAPAVSGSLLSSNWRRWRIRWGLCAVVLVVAPAAVMSGSTGSIQDRLTMWRDVLPNLTIMGHGLGSFYTLYPTFGTIDTLVTRPEHLHNDWLEYAFEVGLVGSIGAFGWVWFSRNMVLAGLAIEATFGFPTHVAATAILGGLVAGHTVRNRADIRDLFHAWRMVLRGWHGNISVGTVHRSIARGGTDISAG